MKKSCKIIKILNFLMLFMIAFAFFSPIMYSEPVFAKTNESELTTAKGMVVLEKDSKRILYSHGENLKLPMASTTKIITAIYAIENIDNLDKVVEIPKDAVGIEGTSIGLKAGEHLTIRELLYGLMLRSGNDSAVALAIATSGSLGEFIFGVNNYLKVTIGVENTNIKNPHGLHDDEHYTTASDLAKITAYALNNPVFKEIVSTKEKQISNELNSKADRNLKNKNKLLKNYEYADGVKTGFTRKAGRCFVGSATKNGMTLICVLLNCNPMFEECEQLLNKGFNEYKLYKLISKGDYIGAIKVDKSKTDSINLNHQKDFVYPLKRDELKDIKLTVNYEKTMVAPINKGQELAEVNLTLKKQLIFSDKLYNINYIKPNTLSSEIKRVLDKM